MTSFQGKGFVGNWAPEKMVEATEQALACAAARGAVLVEREAKEALSRPGPTRTHTAGSSVGGETVRASVPGEPPRKRLGILLNSVSSEPVNESKTIQRVGTHLPYGFFLEFGTKRGLKSRPWLRPTLKKLAGKLRAIFIEEAKRK